jgi:hypothetical protein
VIANVTEPEETVTAEGATVHSLNVTAIDPGADGDAD